MVKAVADSFPSLKTLHFKCENCNGIPGYPPTFFSGCFFAALPRLRLPGLTDLALLSQYTSGGDVWPPGCIQCIASLTGLSTLRIPTLSLNQDQAQLLANMPSLTDLCVSKIQLSTAIDAQECAWRRLDLHMIYGNPAQVLFLPLKAGVELRLHRIISWTLGDATTAAEVEAEARTLAQASELISGCLCGPPPPHLCLMWPSNDDHDDEDHVPRPAAGRSAELIAALAPFGKISCLLTLYHFTVDAAEAQALASALPCSSGLQFIDCLVTSEAWVLLHGLQFCADIDIKGHTAVNASDILMFASTVRQGCKIHLERDWREELGEGWFDPIEEARDTVVAAMPALFSHRQKTGRPLVEIVFDLDE